MIVAGLAVMLMTMAIMLEVTEELTIVAVVLAT